MDALVDRLFQPFNTHIGKQPLTRQLVYKNIGQIKHQEQCILPVAGLSEQ